VLILEDAKGKKVAANDDVEPGNLNSRIVYTPTVDGAYRIVATCLDAKNGAFTLKVAEGKAVAKADVKAIDLKVGKEVEGKLSDAVKTIVYKIRLEKDKEYVIDMTSTNAKVDPLLILKDAKGKVLAEDDDGGGFPNARIQFTAPATELYFIHATSFMQAADGEYALKVREKE
jgi:hypothetical protein